MMIHKRENRKYKFSATLPRLFHCSESECQPVDYTIVCMLYVYLQNAIQANYATQLKFSVLPQTYDFYK